MVLKQTLLTLQSQLLQPVNDETINFCPQREQARELAYKTVSELQSETNSHLLSLASVTQRKKNLIPDALQNSIKFFYGPKFFANLLFNQNHGFKLLRQSLLQQEGNFLKLFTRFAPDFQAFIDQNFTDTEDLLRHDTILAKALGIKAETRTKSQLAILELLLQKKLIAPKFPGVEEHQTIKDLLKKYPRILTLPRGSNEVSPIALNETELSKNTLYRMYGDGFEYLSVILYTLLDPEVRAQVQVSPSSPDLSRRVVDMVSHDTAVEVKTGTINTHATSQFQTLKDQFSKITYIVPENRLESHQTKFTKFSDQETAIEIITLEDIIQKLPLSLRFRNHELVEIFKNREHFLEYLLNNDLYPERDLYSVMIYLLNYPQSPTDTLFLMNAALKKELQILATQRFPHLKWLNQNEYLAIRNKFYCPHPELTDSKQIDIAV